MPNLETIVYVAPMANYLSNSMILLGTMTVPVALGTGYTLGATQSLGLRDGKSGAKLMWDILTKVDVRDLYNSIRHNNPELLDEKYGHIFQKYFLDATTQ